MLHKGKPRIFDASVRASNHSRTSSTFTTSYNSKNPHLTKKHKLHSKSTYFYRWGSNLQYLVPSVCGLALLAGGIITISPIINQANQVYADEVVDNPKGCSTNNSNTAACIKLVVTPNTADSTNGAVKVGEVAYYSNNVEVSGNHLGQYFLTLNTGSGNDGNLVGAANSYATVGKVSSNTASTAFPDNTWGYAISDSTTTDKAAMTYNPVPSGNDTNNSNYLAIKSSLNAASFTDNYKLVFAAKLGSNMPADHYKTDIYVSAVGNAESVANLGFTGGGKTIYAMQDMTSAICNGATTNTTGRLYDTRDYKFYWIGKLADGKCWMTQNLDYDIKKGDFAGAIDTRTDRYVNTGWSNIMTEVQSWDPGTYYYKYVSNWDDCGSSLGNMSTCPNKDNWSATAPATEGEHYHVGNYYSWNAATAGTGGSITSGQANASICPKGWELPTSNGDTADFGKLMSTYKITSSNVDGVRKTPLYFIPAGTVNGNGLTSAGSWGYYWSSTADSQGSLVYHLLFSSGDLRPSNRVDRNYGISVRCVAK